MWQFSGESISNTVCAYRISREGTVLSAGEVIGLWQNSEDFRCFFVGLLTAAPFDCYRWETPGLTSHTLARPFECVLIADKAINVAPDYGDFKQYFSDKSTAQVVQFTNLGGDAQLVVPAPGVVSQNYSHIGAFTRNAPMEQQCELWRQVGGAMRRRLSNRPVWLNTAGGGVPWLHVRLDNRPKYYRYAPYQQL